VNQPKHRFSESTETGSVNQPKHRFNESTHSEIFFPFKEFQPISNNLFLGLT